MRSFIGFFLAMFFFNGMVFCQVNNDYNFNSGQQPKEGYQEPKETNHPPKDSIAGPVEKETFATYPGDLDSLKLEILNLKKDLTLLRTDLSGVQMNLNLCHKKFRTGALIFGAGIAAYFIGSISAANNTGTISSESVLLILGGFGATVTGGILMINSHRYIGKAGVNMRRYTRTARYQQR
jgi:hypothetical protein